MAIKNRPLNDKERELWAAFKAGFATSGEGWNGELLFTHSDPHLPTQEDWDLLRKNFRKWLKEEHHVTVNN